VRTSKKSRNNLITGRGGKACGKGWDKRKKKEGFPMNARMKYLSKSFCRGRTVPSRKGKLKALGRGKRTRGLRLAEAFGKPLTVFKKGHKPDLPGGKKKEKGSGSAVRKQKRASSEQEKKLRREEMSGQERGDAVRCRLGKKVLKPPGKIEDHQKKKR